MTWMTKMKKKNGIRCPVIHGGKPRDKSRMGKCQGRREKRGKRKRRKKKKKRKNALASNSENVQAEHPPPPPIFLRWQSL